MKRRISILFTIATVLLVSLFLGLAQISNHAAAGPQVVGNPDGATARYLVSDGQGGTVKRIVYVSSGTKTMIGANTPVVSDPVCGLMGDLHRADVRLTGTMAGTAPTLAILWQNSIDGGTTWSSVGTWTTINATVTPAAQSQVVSDISNATTAVAYGDCWRATYTFGGTGTVTANFDIVGIEK